MTRNVDSSLRGGGGKYDGLKSGLFRMQAFSCVVCVHGLRV